MESLRSAGSPAEQLLEVMTFRRADGREIALGELPLAATLSGAETVRAEEIVLSVPDGRSVTTLVNATPIHGEDGAVVSMVVTLQDLAPLQELERMRAEFLGLVSHELRAPLTSIKGSTAAVLGAGRVFGAVEMREFFRIIDGQADHMIGLVADLLDAGRIDAGTLSVAPEPTEVAVLVDQARNTFLSGGARHTVLIDLPPGLAPVMADRQQLLADIQAHKVDTVVVYKVDRLTRSLADFAKIVEVFDAHEVSFVSVTQQFNTTTSMGRLTLNMLLMGPPDPA